MAFNVLKLLISVVGRINGAIGNIGSLVKNIEREDAKSEIAVRRSKELLRELLKRIREKYHKQVIVR